MFNAQNFPLFTGTKNVLFSNKSVLLYTIYVHRNKISWPEALRLCDLKNQTLAKIHSLSDRKHVKQVISDFIRDRLLMSFGSPWFYIGGRHYVDGKNTES